MKLLYCSECEDVLAIKKDPRWCECTQSSAVSLGGDRVGVAGPARVMEITEHWMERALAAPAGRFFDWAFLRQDEPTVKTQIRVRRATRLPKVPSYLPEDE